MKLASIGPAAPACPPGGSQPGRSTVCAIVAALAAAAPAAAEEPGRATVPWWQRPADTWYYKDDWKGQALSGGGRGGGFTKTIEAPGGPPGAKSGWIIIWGDRGYRLLVDDKPVGSNVDGGLIDDYDLTPFIAGSAKVTVRIEGARVCAEGGIVGADGKETAFATGEDWSAGAGGGRARAERMAVGPSTGAFHRAHNARLTTYNDEQRGKTAIAKALARIQKLREQGVFLMRRYRPAEEILSFSPEDPWRRAEGLAEPLLERAQAILRDKAIPAQQAGRFGEAIAAAQEAGVLLSAAEAPVAAATAIYQAQRAATHLGNLAAMLGKPPGGRGQAGAGASAGASAKNLPGGVRDDIDELWRLLASARREHALGDWPGAHKAVERVEALCSGIRARSEAFAAASPSGPLIGGAAQLDEYPEDRFAWLNAKELMGNDPERWPFSMLPSSLPYADLAGMWRFRTDPDNVGEKEGWPTGQASGWARIYAPCPWERQGYNDDNRKAPGAPIGKGATGRDKPYNGFAWYRKDVRVPESWRGGKVVLIVGKIDNWSRIFINGKATPPAVPEPEGRRLSPATTIELPAEAIRFGQDNVVAIQVYNHDNFGGIVAGPLALGLAAGRPEARNTAAPMAHVREWTFADAAGPAGLTFFCGAMSPAVLVACQRPALELWGWQAKGHEAPSALVLPAAGGPQTVKLDKPGELLPPGGLAEGWLILQGAAGQTLIVLERRCKSIAWKPNAHGSMSLEIGLESAPARAAVLVAGPEAKIGPLGPASRAFWAFWQEALRQYPVSASQCLRAAPPAAGAAAGPAPAGSNLAAIRYNYWALGEPADASAVAPVPMLASFALKHGHPGVAVEGAREAPWQLPYAPYRFVEAADTLIYRTPPVDRSRMMKGVGELFARKSAAGNAHGAYGEKEMFQLQAAWGFDHNRYALAFSADWDLPLVKSNGGPINEDEALWKRLDELIANCNAAGVQMMLCWFPEIESRRWKDRPEQQANLYEFWRRVARRYASLPDWAISYDFFNEPAYMNTDHWNAVMKELAKIVRSVDKRHMIVWESADGWAQPHWCLWMEPVADDNVLYSFHHYGKHWGYAYDEYYPGYQCTHERTQIDPWLEAILFGIKAKAPIHCGEFGISMIRPAGDAEAWLNDYLAFFERMGIGWNWWNFSGQDIYRTGLVAGRQESPFVPILRKWAARSGWGAARRAAAAR